MLSRGPWSWTARFALLASTSLVSLVSLVSLISIASMLTLSMTALAATDCEQEISVHCGAAPSATYDPDGRLWVAFVQDEVVYVANSSDDGASYSQPIAVNRVPENAEHNGENRPKILAANDALYVSWTLKTSQRFTGEIRFSRSLDGGQNFEEPRTINDDKLFAGHRFESLFLTESGHLYLTWIDKRDLTASIEKGEDYAGAAIYYTVSSDGGASFAPNVRVADHSCECCRIAVAPEGEANIAIIWRQIFGTTTRDHAIAVLSPDGDVSAYDRASYDEWQIDACPHHGPTMIASEDSDAYHMSWFSNDDAHSGIYYARYSMSEHEPQNVFQVDGNAGAGHPFLAESNGVLHLVWKAFDGEKTLLQLITSHDDGASWSEAETLLTTDQGSDHPLLVTKGEKGPLFLSWHTQEQGYVFEPLAALSRVASGELFVPFTRESLAAIKAEYIGSEFLLGLWSIDCPPCLVELSLMAKVLEERPNVPYVLVSTDSIELKETAAEYLEDFGLAGRASYMFADSFAERLRFSIDPNWYGELPRSYFFDESHEFKAHSGIVSEALLAEWFGW